MNTRRDNTRVIRAATGTTLTAKSWLTEAPLRMLMNNLDPGVAERPESSSSMAASAARRAAGRPSTASWHLSVAGGRRDAPGAVGQARGHLPHPQGRTARTHRQLKPRAALGHLGPFQRTGPQGPHDVRPDDGRLLDLHWHPGHRAGHLRDLRRGWTKALRWQAQGQVVPHRGPRRHGRRPAARRHYGRRLDDCHRMPTQPHRFSNPHRYLDTQARTIDEALEIIDRSHKAASRSAWVCSAMLPNSCPSSSSAASGRCAHRPDLGT